MAWLNYSDGQGLLLPGVCAAAAHELGHWAAIRLSGGRVAQLRLTVAGAELQVVGFMGYTRELLCAAAGPAVNLVLALGAAQLGLFAFSGLNLVMGLFNLLPLGMLDGGRILSCIAGMWFPTHWEGRRLSQLEHMGAILLVLCGGLLLGVGGNGTLFAVSVWLVAALSRTKEKTWRKKGLSRGA